MSIYVQSEVTAHSYTFPAEYTKYRVKGLTNKFAQVTFIPSHIITTEGVQSSSENSHCGHIMYR